MWSKIFGLALAVIPFQAPAHEGEPSPPYEVKETTRFYRSDSYDEKSKKSIYLSFVVPKGFTLEGCGGVTPGFLEGANCWQDEFPTLRGVLEKNGVRRMLEISLGGGYNFKVFPKMGNLDGRLVSNKQAAMGLEPGEELVRHGEFFVGGKETGYFAVKHRPQRPDVLYSKHVYRSDMPCALNGDYTEKSPDGASYIHPKDWVFEDLFDEVVRSMRCEVVAKKYMDKWRKRFHEIQTRKTPTKKAK